MVLFSPRVIVGPVAFTGAPVPVVAVSAEVKFPLPSASTIREAVKPPMLIPLNPVAKEQVESLLLQVIGNPSAVGAAAGRVRVEASARVITGRVTVPLNVQFCVAIQSNKLPRLNLLSDAPDVNGLSTT
jgi:hypothetical protein